MQTIKIKVGSDSGRNYGWETVKAYIRSPFAIHRPLIEKPDYWTISHTATGRALSNARTRTECEKLVAYILATLPDNTLAELAQTTNAQTAGKLLKPVAAACIATRRNNAFTVPSESADPIVPDKFAITLQNRRTKEKRRFTLSVAECMAQENDGICECVNECCGQLEPDAQPECGWPTKVNALFVAAHNM